MIPGDWLKARAQATPHKLALIIEEERWTYSQLNRLVDEECRRLRQIGVTPRAHIGALMANNLRYVCLVHALMRLDAVLVPLNIRQTPTELRWQLQQADCDFLLHDDHHANLAADLLPLAPRKNRPPHAGNVIIFTSGTTGKPKGVTLTAANHFWSAAASAYRLGIDPDDIWLSCLPMYHMGGLAIVYRSCLYGTAIDLHPRFQLETVSQRLDELPITLISLVPTMIFRLLAHRGERPWSPTLRHLLAGGAATSPRLAARCQALGIPIAATYGMTETASQFATQTPADTLKKPGSVGKPLLFGKVRIEPLPHGGDQSPQIGEVVVSGNMVMAGYYNDAEATEQHLRNGEFHTGDLGYLDEDGDLWLVQRRSDLIISGGENIYPVEVEGILREHPAVADACVVGIPHPEWGQQTAAMAQLTSDGAISADDLIDHCRGSLAGYKIPRQIRFTPALPQTASGKIHRQRVQDSFR